MPSYNLVYERWIPCIMGDGSREPFGLKDTLVRAHEIREVFDLSPLVTVALHRLLLAILHRCFGPRKLDDWVTLWGKDAWDRAVLDDYLDKWKHRFDLFDGKRPFYQVPEMTGVERHPVLLLAQEVACGNNPTLFDHSLDESPRAITCGEAARYLLAQQAFSIGFGKSAPFYFSDAPLTRGYTVLITGDNLFQTLALNLVGYNEERPIPHKGTDLPAWEVSAAAVPDRSGTLPQGYLDYLTWQSRRIHLFPEGDPPVARWCQRQQNLKLGGDYLDPFMCFPKNKEVGYRPRGLVPEKALWRDSHTLFQMSGEGGGRAEIFNWVARIEKQRRAGLLTAKPAYGFSVFGFAAEHGRAASVVLWRHERLPLPLAYLDDNDLLAKLREALDLSQKTRDALRQSAWRLTQMLLAPESDTPGARQADKEAVRQLVDSLAPDRSYWPRLETPFKKLLVDLPGDRDNAGEYGAKALPEWAGMLCKVARQTFEETTRSMDTSARTLKAVARAEAEFRRGLNRVLGDYLKTEEGGDA